MTPSERGPERDDSADDTRPESGMGGTSDAGGAADDAAEAAAFRRGLPDDATRGVNTTPGAGTGHRQGTRGTSGGQTPGDDELRNVNLEGDDTEKGFEDRGGGLR